MSKTKAQQEEKDQDQAPAQLMLTVHRARQAAMLGISHAWQKAAAKQIPSDDAPGMLRRLRVEDVLDCIREAAEQVVR